MAKRRKTAALLMALLLLFSCMPAAAFAQEKEEQCTETEILNSEQEAPEESEIPEDRDPADHPPEEEAPGIAEPEEEQTGPDQGALPEEQPAEGPAGTEEQEETAEEEIAEETGEPDLPETEPAEEPEERTEGPGQPEENKQEEPDTGTVPCTVTVALGDIRDGVLIRINGEIRAQVLGNYATGEGTFYLAGPDRLEALAPDPDGYTRLRFEAFTGDTAVIGTVCPPYAKIRYTSDAAIETAETGDTAVCSVLLNGDTEIRADGDYAASKGYFPVGGSKGMQAAKGAWTPPDALYVSLGSCYSDYSSTAVVNGHTGVYFFQPEEQGEGKFLSATCGSTTKHMVSGVHYKVARIAEAKARQYLDYGTGCCSQRAQRALAWITHHGQSEYDWRRFNENRYVMGDDTLTVSNQLEAYTITFLAAWVCTNDGRTGAYGTVHAQDGAHALDFLFGSSFSTGLPVSTRSGIDRMVSKGLAFADAHPDPDADLPEYQQTFVYADGYGDHQPLLVGAFQGPGNATLTVTKSSSDTQCTKGNRMYSFEGTTFEVRDSGGKVVGKLVADESGKTGKLELEPGTYTVTETKAGKGYIRNTGTKTVTLSAGDEKTVSFKNTPLKDPALFEIRKWDTETDRYVPQGSGTFAGAQYRLDYYDNTAWSGTPKGSWTFQTDADGVIKYLPEYKVSGPDLYRWGEAYLLPLGSFKVTEVKAPEGYRMAADVLYATITQNSSGVELKWTTETQGLIKAYADGYGVPEEAVRGGVRFRKTDRETGKPVAGAEISVYNASGADVLVDGVLYADGERVAVLTTDTEGVCETAADLLPYGSYCAAETKASEGYLLNGTWRAEFRIAEHGKILDLTGPDHVLEEQIIRGDLSLLKLDIGGNYKPNIPFLIVRLGEDGEETEAHVIVTDANGRIDTASSARPHTERTNSLDAYAEGGVFTDPSMLDPTAGVWFGDGDPDDSLGALPYGNYKVYELQTEQMAAEQVNLLESKIVEIREPDVTVVLSPMVNLNVHLRSEAASADGRNFIPAAAVRVVDTVYYANLTSGRRYTMETQFVLKSTSEVLASTSTDFVPPEGEDGTHTADGSVTLEAEIDVTDHPGDLVVACDYLYEYVKGTKILIASHADMEDKAQTLRIPAIYTSAADTETGDGTGTVSGNAGIVDTVFYTNLSRGEVFVLRARLADPETGETLAGADGEPFTAEKRFVCAAEEGSMEMPVFRIDSAQYAGRSVVVMERLYWVDEEHGNEEVLMAAHESPDDRDQTVSYPEVRTSAKDRDTEERIGAVSEETVIEDTVTLSNLIPGKEYTVTGRLVYQEDCTDREGKTHKAGDPVPVKDTSEDSVTFTADAPETEVTLTYAVDSSLLEGTGAVVFEDLIHNGILVASHADLTDRDQTVSFPKLRTSAADLTSGTFFVTKGTETCFTDTVSYSNVIPGLRYVVKGVLMDRNTGESLHHYAVSSVFTPSGTSGTVQVGYRIGAAELPSTVIVVFEDLYLVREDGTEVLLVKHADLNDEAQSLYFPEIGTTASDGRSGTHEAQAGKETVLTDTVSYRNLKPGLEYTLTGTLTDRSTGKPLVIGGRRITAKTVFTPKEKDGTVTVSFRFDATGLAGKTVVVFERLLFEGREIASHTDPEDREQSVNLIDIRTSASDRASGGHTVTHSRAAVLTDTVSYKGLTPGKTYTLRGTVMLKSTGAALLQNGKTVTGTAEFVPAKSDGTAEVRFVIDTYPLQGMELVVFEQLFAGSDVPVAVHEDLNDRDQTLSVPRIMEPPVDTGVKDHIRVLLGIMVTSGAGLICILRRRKKH